MKQIAVVTGAFAVASGVLVGGVDRYSGRKS